MWSPPTAPLGLPTPCRRPGGSLPRAAHWFLPCPRHGGRQAVIALRNAGKGLAVSLLGLAPGVTGSISTPVFVEPYTATSSFAMVASPTLYSGQTVTAKLARTGGVRARLYTLYYGGDDEIERLDSEWSALDSNEPTLGWTIPATNGLPLYRLGIEFASDNRFDGEVRIESIDWHGAPAAFEIHGMLMKSIWNLTPFWTRAWVSSARHFAPDFKWTICISHPEENGVVTTGSRDWDDYDVASSIEYSLNEGGGLVARARGHRRYYAGILKGREALILKRCDETVAVLARAEVGTGASSKRDLRLSLKGDHLRFAVDGKEIASVRDGSFTSGGAGFLVERGTIVADGFLVHALGRSA
jgi:hypothetical protein